MNYYLANILMVILSVIIIGVFFLAVGTDLALDAWPFILLDLSPLLINHLVFCRVYSGKSQALLIFTHIAYAIWLGITWSFALSPSADPIGGGLAVMFMVAPAAPFFLTLWIIAIGWDGKYETEERISRHGPLIATRYDVDEDQNTTKV